MELFWLLFGEGLGRLGRTRATDLLVISPLTRMFKRPKTVTRASLAVQNVKMSEREGQEGQITISVKNAPEAVD